MQKSVSQTGKDALHAQEGRLAIWLPGRLAWPPLANVLLVVVLISAAAASRFFLQDTLGIQIPYLTFFFSVFLITVYGGLWPGLLAILLSVLVIDYLWLEPVGGLFLMALPDQISLSLFVVTCLIVSLFINRMHFKQKLALDEQERLTAAQKAVETTYMEEMVQMVLALQKSEQRYSLAVETANDGIWDLDLTTGDCFFSERWKSMLGYGDEDLEGISGEMFWKSLIHPDDYGKTMAALEGYLEGIVPEYMLEYRLLHKDGNYRWILTRGACCRDSQNKPFRLAGAHTDIHTLKMAQQALAQESAKTIDALEALHEKEQMLLLQSRQAAMGEMIGNIAHQWRQPLNTLGLLIQQTPMLYDLGGVDRDFLVENTEKCMEIIQHMSRTIDDFRTFFKPEKECTIFNVQDVLANALSLIGDSFNDSGIMVETICRDDLIMSGYPNELAQVLLNILNNARDAILDRGIDQPKVTIMLQREGPCSVVTVTDNAGGIPEKIISKVFDPYFTTKGPQYGTGVGLYMSKTIVEKNMGGRLTASNVEGGAQFRIEMAAEPRRSGVQA